MAAVGGLAIPAILLALLAIPVGIVALLYLIMPVFKGIGFIIRQAFGFVGGEVGDALRILGALITQAAFFLLTVLNLVIGRWSAAAHFGRAVSAECRTMGVCLYRMAVGHPARLLCLTALTEGLEKRIPAAIAAAPTADAPNPKRAGQFEGYTIVGSLPGGGSGGKLYVAEPDAIKHASFERAGQHAVRQVVIKTFSLRDGSSLPQIVRESRALDAAKRLGLVLDHALTAERFFYVMRYVPGDSLGLVTQRLHASSEGHGLEGSALATAMNYGADLLRTLHGYHAGGLWHKDVKPDNIIVDGRSAHLVDFGLVTPLRSAMTLTTHGTEYFRDPEMVRLALKGVKVDQVDGAKFDIYAAGAVLFSVIENSFPAHGGLSQITRRCPEALRWIVRRAMAEYDKRYPTSAAMLTDLDFVRRAPDPFGVKPADLPSMWDVEETIATPVVADDAPLRRTPEPVTLGDGSGEARPLAGLDASPQVVAAAGSPEPRDRRRPKLRVRSWWTGGYITEDDGAPSPGQGAEFLAGGGVVPPVMPVGDGWQRRAAVGTARAQVEHARARVAAARERARARIRQRRRERGDFKTVNHGVGMAVLVVLAAFALLFWGVVSGKPRNSRVFRNYGDSRTPALAFANGELPDDATERAATRRSSSGAPQMMVNGHRVASIGPGVSAAVTGQRALIISDIQPATGPIGAAVARLKTAGFSLVGNYPGHTAAPGQIEDEVKLEAEARTIRAMESLEDDHVSARLSQWLAEHKGLDLLVWFAKAGDDGTVHYFLVTPAATAGSGSHDMVFRAGMDVLAGRVN